MNIRLGAGRGALFSSLLSILLLLLCVPSPSHAWDVVLEDDDGWRISLNLARTTRPFQFYEGELWFPLRSMATFRGTAIAFHDRRRDELLIMTVGDIVRESGSSPYNYYGIMYHFDWVGEGHNLHGTYGLWSDGYTREGIRPRGFHGTVSAQLLEGTMGTHEAPTTRSARRAGESIEQEGAEAPYRFGPAPNGMALALNEREFDGDDRLVLHLRVDGSLFEGVRADLWLRITAPSGARVYLDEGGAITAQALPFKRAWQVADVAADEILNIPLSGVTESGTYLIQAILTEPGRSPDAPEGWITSTATVASVAAPYDALGNRVVRLGALLPLSGALATHGAAASEALRLAVADINRTAREQGMGLNVRLLSADSATSPPTAYEGFSELVSQGADIVLGPLSSASARVVKEQAVDQGLVYLSASSTATELARGDDNFIRLVADDSHHARALAARMAERGITRLAILARSDTYGRSFSEALSTAFTEAGGEVFLTRELGRGEVGAAPLMAELSGEVSAQSALGHGAAEIGVVLVTFSEAVDLLEAAAAESLLGDVQWFAGDGVALETLITDNATAAGFAARVGLRCSMMARGTSAAYGALEQRLTLALGHTPSPIAVGYYDAAWIAALALLDVGDQAQDPARVMETLRTTAANHTGVLGPYQLNAADDRVEGSYDFWGIREATSGYEWYLVR